MPIVLKVLIGAVMVGVGAGLILDWYRDFYEYEYPPYVVLAAGSSLLTFGIYIIAG